MSYDLSRLAAGFCWDAGCDDCLGAFGNTGLDVGQGPQSDSIQILEYECLGYARASIERAMDSPESHKKENEKEKNPTWLAAPSDTTHSTGTKADTC